MVDALLIDGTGAVWLHPSPRRRKAVTFLIETLEYFDVLFVTVVLIAGAVAGSSTFNFAYGVRKAVPIRFALAVFSPCAFYLIRSGGHAP